MDIGFSEKHYKECPRCQEMIDTDANFLEWHDAWEKLNADAKKGTAAMLGSAFALACGVLLYSVGQWILR